MRKRLLNADDDKDDDENKLLRTRDMNVIQLNPKVKTIVGIIFVVSVLIFLMYLPIFSSTTVDFEIPNVDHVVHDQRYVSEGSLKNVAILKSTFF
jgi:hypothetical protein